MSKRERALLVNPSQDLRKPDSVEPLGIEYLAAQLEQEGTTVHILDGAVRPIRKEQIEGYSFVGVTATTPQYSRALEILEICEDLSNNSQEKIRTCLGGPHITAITEQFKKKGVEDPGSVFEKEGWDTICSREGDLIIDDVLNEHVMGFIEGPRVHDLDSLPFPARHLVNPLNYSKEGYPPAISILFSRGCPFACTYCDKSVMGNLTRFRSPENVVEEIRYVIDIWGIKRVLFYDDTLTLNRERAMELFEALTPLEIYWECNSRVDLIDSEMLVAMKKAGCYKVKYGVESGDQRILDSMKKKITVEQAIEAIKITKEARIKAAAYFLYGLPEDDWHSLNNNLDFLNEAQPDSAQLAFAVPYPNTPLFEEVTRLGWEIPDDYNEYYYAGIKGSHTFLKRTKHLNEKEFSEALEKIQEGFARWATQTNNGEVRVTNIIR